MSAGRPVLRREHGETTSFLEGYLLSGSSLVYRFCCLLSTSRSDRHGVNGEN